MSRAFKTLDKQITGSGDHTSAIKRKTLFRTMREKLKTEKGAANIRKYDNVYNVSWCSADAGTIGTPVFPTGELISSHSYEAYLDIAKGKRLTNPVLNGSSAAKFNIYTGNFAQITPRTDYPIVIPTEWKEVKSGTGSTAWQYYGDRLVPYPRYEQAYSSAGARTDFENAVSVNSIPFPNTSQVGSVTDASWNVTNYPGWLADPYGIFFNSSCDTNQAPTLGKRLVNEVVIDWRWTSAYWRSVSGQTMSGFSFPTKVTFDYQPSEGSQVLVQKYGPEASAEKPSTITSPAELQLAQWCDSFG